MQTQAQLFAAQYAKTLAVGMLRTIRLVRLAANVIMVVAMATSYSHQAHFLADLGMPPFAAWSIPGALDSLTFLCVKVLSTAAVIRPARVTAGVVLAFPVATSGVVNFIAPGALVVKCVYVVAVLLIPAAELVAGRIKPDFAAMDEMERKLRPVEQSANVVVPDTAAELESPSMPEAPVSPAVSAGKSRGSYGPRRGESYSERHDRRLRNGK